MKDFTCRITLAEAHLLRRFHATEPDAVDDNLHAARARYWSDLIDKAAQSTPSPDHRLHSYTHAPDGALVRLDIPSDDEL